LAGNLTKANPRICEILGYSETEVLEKTIFDLAHQEDMGRLEVCWQKFIVGGTRVRLSWRSVVCIKMGANVWVNAAIAAR